MTFAAAATLLVIFIVLVLLVKFNRAPDFTIWGGLGLLMLLPVRDPHGTGWVWGVVTPGAALSGLANESVATIAALFIVAAGLRETGAFSWIVNRFLGSPGSVTDAQNRIVWPTAALSAFLNNTPLVAMLLPVANDWARKHQISPSKLLLPLSYASILGGACTLVGTSTNLIVNGWLIQETPDKTGLGMFEMSVVMVPIAVLGILFMLFTSRWLLPERRPAFSPADDAREYTVEMIVEPESDLVGKTVEDAGLRGLPGLFLIEIERESETLAAVSGNVLLRASDRLVFAGIVDSVVDLQKIRGLRPATEQVFKLDEKRHNRMLVEAVLSNTCPLIGRTIKEGRFRTRYNAAVIAVARSGERIRGKIGDIRLRTGDTLLLDARTGFLAQQRNSRDFFLVSGTSAKAAVHYQRAPISMGILVALVATVSVGLVSMVQAAIAAAALTVATRCCRASVARRSIDWEVLLVIGGAIGLGKAMEASGLAEILGHSVRELFGTDPKLMLGAIFLLAMLLSNIVTAKAGAVLMLPIAMSAANDLDVSFMPYVIAVMLASSTALATPIGYPTNLMVLGPGGYRFGDYLRMGAPLSILVLVLSVYMIPLFWPF